MKYYGYIKAKTKKELETKKNEIMEYVKDGNNEINFITQLSHIKPSCFLV